MNIAMEPSVANGIAAKLRRIQAKNEPLFTNKIRKFNILKYCGISFLIQGLL